MTDRRADLTRRAEERCERLTVKLSEMPLKDKLFILDGMEVWATTTAAIQGEAEAWLENGTPFTDDMTIALAMVEYRRRGTRPAQRMSALRMIESVQRRRAGIMKARVLRRVRELDGIERGWLLAKERSKRTAATLRRHHKRLEDAKAAREDRQGDTAAELTEAEIEAQIMEHLK